MGVTAAVAAVVGTAYTVYSGERAADAQNKALDQQRSAQAQATANAERQAKLAEENVNRANAKSPDTGAIMAASEQAAKGGVAGTMLTGSQGVNPQQLALGKNTLLGA